MALKVCAEPGCPDLTEDSRCEAHTKQRRKASDKRRPNAAKRGYGPRWRLIRQRFLRSHPLCLDCGAQATVPDHDPVSRADLVAQGDPDPDAWHHLVPRCERCHNKRTAKAQPGGWAA